MKTNILRQRKKPKRKTSKLSKEEIISLREGKDETFNKNQYHNNKVIYIFLCIFIILFIFFIILFFKKNVNNINKNNNININNSINDEDEKIELDKYEVEKYNEIKEKVLQCDITMMWDNQREFLNGVVRKFKPKKVLEIGVRKGGSSIIILNAINDIPDAKLYSIDISEDSFIGECVGRDFPQFLSKWTLFKGNMANEFIEKIGNNIDMVFIDTAHLEPGEILDFIIALPFLREEAVAIFHDIGNQITRSPVRNEWAPYIIYNGIRGKKYLPSGSNVLTKDIGAAKLDKDQRKYYHEYFRLLGGQWQYMPKEIHINKIREYFKKYYDNYCTTAFEEAITFNKKFVKNNPKSAFYKENTD